MPVLIRSVRQWSLYLSFFLMINGGNATIFIMSLQCTCDYNGYIFYSRFWFFFSNRKWIIHFPFVNHFDTILGLVNYSVHGQFVCLECGQRGINRRVVFKTRHGLWCVVDERERKKKIQLKYLPSAIGSSKIKTKLQKNTYPWRMGVGRVCEHLQLTRPRDLRNMINSSSLPIRENTQIRTDQEFLWG